MQKWKKAFITFVVGLSLLVNGCTLFPSNKPNQPGPVRYKTTRKVVPTIPIRPTKMGRAVRVIPTKIGKTVRVIPTKVKVLPTKIGGTIKRKVNKITPLTPIPTPKALKGMSGTR